jgi:hypothetical protein
LFAALFQAAVLFFRDSEHWLAVRRLTHCYSAPNSNFSTGLGTCLRTRIVIGSVLDSIIYTCNHNGV